MFFLCVNRSGGFQFCKIKNSSLICSILLVVEPDAATKLCSLYFREKQHKRLSSPVPCDNYKLASNLSVNVIKSGLVSHTYHVRQPSPWLVCWGPACLSCSMLTEPVAQLLPGFSYFPPRPSIKLELLVTIMARASVPAPWQNCLTRWPTSPTFSIVRTTRSFTAPWRRRSP